MNHGGFTIKLLLVLVIFITLWPKFWSLLNFQTHEILKEATSVLEDEMWLFSAGVEHPVRYNHNMKMQRTIPSVAAKAEFGLIITPASLFGKPSSLANAFNSLLVLQDIIMMILSCHHGEYDKGELFFSKLGSVCTISDCILRKLRGFLKVVSLDYTKLELLGEGIEKSLPNKSKEKLGACSRRKKGRPRNMKRVNPRLDDFPCDKSPKVLFYALKSLLKSFYTHIHTLRLCSNKCSE